MILHLQKFRSGSSQEESKENSQEIERQEVDFVELEKNQNDEVIDESCDRDETLADPLDNQSDITASANVVPSPTVLPLPNVVPSGLQTNNNIMSPEAVRPKKVFNENTSKKGREKGKSRVYTDTPEKNRLQMLHKEKKRKRQVKLIKQKAKELKTAKNLLGLTETKKLKKKKVCPRLKPMSDSDSSQNESLKLSDNDDNEESDAGGEEEFDVPNPENINIGDFLLIKFEKKKSVVYYVAKVISKYNLTDYQVSYLRKTPRSYVFIFLNVEDKASVYFRDVVLHLPKPNFSKGTARTSSLYTFSVDLSAYNVQ